jgi:acyl carrier protein
VDNGTVKEKIRSFLLDYHIDSKILPRDLTDHFPLIESAALDSLAVVSLVVFIESEFVISVELEDLTNVNFGSLANLDQFIRSRMRAGVPGDPGYDDSPEFLE